MLKSKMTVFMLAVYDTTQKRTSFYYYVGYDFKVMFAGQQPLLSITIRSTFCSTYQMEH